jgi:hypothetical protein
LLGFIPGLQEGRNMLYKWGYRRCEDIVWLRTNKNTGVSFCPASLQFP